MIASAGAADGWAASSGLLIVRALARVVVGREDRLLMECLEVRLLGGFQVLRVPKAQNPCGWGPEGRGAGGGAGSRSDRRGQAR